MNHMLTARFGRPARIVQAIAKLKLAKQGPAAGGLSAVRSGCDFPTVARQHRHLPRKRRTSIWQRCQEVIELAIVLGRLRVVVVAALDRDEVFRLIGCCEEFFSLPERNQAIGTAMAV